MIEQVYQESAGFSPRGKYHLATDARARALCGAEPRMSVVWNVSGDRDSFERACPERICKRCRKAEA